jgi:Domain of unknown function (DUF4351)
LSNALFPQNPLPIRIFDLIQKFAPQPAECGVNSNAIAFKKKRLLILRLLTRRFGTIAPTTETQIRSLSLSQLEALGEALLDFSQPSDLMDWLRTLGA